MSYYQPFSYSIGSRPWTAVENSCYLGKLHKLMEDQKHYIIVDNETYELYDSNGSFYVAKASHPTDSFSFQNTFCLMKEPQNNFLDNLAAPVITTDSNVSCQVGQPLEPIIIDDYNNMNYFTQAASDVTIYLNSNNQNNFMEGTNRQSGYFVDSEGVIDLTKLSSNMRQKTTSSFANSNVESSLDLSKTSYNVFNEELDAPEFIDISKLKLSYANAKLTKEVDILPVIKKSKINDTPTPSVANEESDGSDEVIFVKEFKATDENANTPLDLRRKKVNGTRGKTLPEPRRNPKRQVQLLKESFDLALKLSDEEIYYGRTKELSQKDISAEIPRKSTRNTGAVLSPPGVLTDKDYKEWPTEGLHERPIFNMATKKIEKFDFKSVDDKRKSPLKRNDVVAVKTVKGKKPGKKGKRKAPNRSKKAKSESPEKGISKEFASLTHETLQEVIKYVSQVKEYNDIRSGKLNDTEPREATDSLIDDAQLLVTVVRSSNMEENLNHAVDLLTDTCILYSLANNVCQASVAKVITGDKSCVFEYDPETRRQDAPASPQQKTTCSKSRIKACLSASLISVELSIKAHCINARQ
ncbi:hypothetical protein Trydic_g22782 [Trypoxylus dichotomus]